MRGQALLLVDGNGSGEAVSRDFFGCLRMSDDTSDMEQHLGVYVLTPVA